MAVEEGLDTGPVLAIRSLARLRTELQLLVAAVIEANLKIAPGLMFRRSELRLHRPVPGTYVTVNICPGCRGALPRKRQPQNHRRLLVSGAPIACWRSTAVVCT